MDKVHVRNLTGSLLNRSFHNSPCQNGFVTRTLPFVASCYTKSSLYLKPTYSLEVVFLHLNTIIMRTNYLILLSLVSLPSFAQKSEEDAIKKVIQQETYCYFHKDYDG